MTSNISSSTTGHAYRLRPMPTNSLSNNSNSTGSSSNTNTNNNSNSSYYGSSSSAAPVVAPPTWSYSSPSQLARKYANITPIWCHITKPRQLKKKFASTFHPAQSLVNFYNEDRAPSERRGSLNQTPQQQQQSQQTQSQSQSQQQQQQQPIVHTTNANPHHYHHYESNSYRQPYSSHYIPHDHGIEPSAPTASSSSSSSSSRAKKKYTGGAMTTHISSVRLQSPPPPPPISSVAMDEKFSNAGERKARIDQLKDLVFNTRVKDSMIARSDSRNRSTTNLHKANSYKRIDQITNPMDDYQPSVIPPTTPARKDSHYYHYHLPSSTIASIVNENLNRPIVPPPPPVPTAPATSNATVSQPTYNYDYLRAKSKEHTRPTYYESNYLTNQIRPAEIPPPSSSSISQIGSNSSSYVGPTTASTNSANSYRNFDDHGYIGKPGAIVDKNSSYTSITSYPSYQTPGSSKRRIKKYLLAKGTSSSGLSHQTEPIITNMEHLSLHDDEKIINGDSSSVVIANTHAMTPPSPLRTSPSDSKPTTTNTTIIPSLDSTPPIPVIPALSPSSSPVRTTAVPPPPPPPSVSVNNTAVESAVFSTPNAPLSPSPQPNHSNNKIPPVIVVPLSASLTSLNNQQAAIRSTTNSLLELVPLHRDKEQSPSRSIVPAAPEDGCESSVCVCLFAFLEKKLIAVLLQMFELEFSPHFSTHLEVFLLPLIFACFNLLHVFAVLQQHLAIIYKLVHPLNVIVGDDIIDMIHRKIDMVVMAPVEILEQKALQVHLQHRNDIRKRTIQPTIIPITLITIIIIIKNDQPRHPIKK